MSRRRNKHAPQEASVKMQPANSRRSFVAGALALITGALALLVPLGAGVVAFLSPLFKKSAASTNVRIALMSQVPDDGVPRSFPVVTDRVDAWTRYPAQRVGAVYLVREPGGRTDRAHGEMPPRGMLHRLSTR